MFYADYADNCVKHCVISAQCLCILRNVFAQCRKLRRNPSFYAFLRNQVYYAVLWRGGNYPPSRVLRNDGQFLRKVWISNLLRNINFYAIKITRLRNLLRKCFGQAASSPASWFAPCCCAMGMLNFFCLSPDPAPLENIWWQFRISAQAVPS